MVQNGGQMYEIKNGTNAVERETNVQGKIMEQMRRKELQI